jgi:cellulose synthase/poly-beta-1,6-N-acetylglucosamine synthase-like glycosyltransferase
MGELFLMTGGLLLLLALHPYCTYPLSLQVLARMWRCSVHAGEPPPGAVAVCVCAYNEELVIAAKIHNMLAIRSSVPNLEILIYVDGASDRTAEIVESLSQENYSIRAVFSPTRMGKSHGMNLLVSMTAADYVVFTDANVIFAPDAVPHLLAPFTDPEVGCVSGHLVYTTNSNAPTASVGSLYWRLEEQIKRLESACGSAMGADGSIFAIRRRLHRPPPPDLIDDMFVSLSILCAGSRVVQVRDAVAYEEIVSKPKEEFRRKIRIACQSLNVHRALSRELRRLPTAERYKYISHKLLRWFTIYFLCGGALCTIAGLAVAQMWLVFAFALVVAAGFLTSMALAQSGPLCKFRDVLGAFVATGIGVWRSAQGHRFQTWTPPTSARAVSSSDPALPL